LKIQVALVLSLLTVAVLVVGCGGLLWLAAPPDSPMTEHNAACPMCYGRFRIKDLDNLTQPQLFFTQRRCPHCGERFAPVEFKARFTPREKGRQR